MGELIYSIGVGLLRATYRIASWVNPKARRFREGRIHQAESLKRTFPGNHPQPLVWFHCSSLGEFEQGRPVMESLKAARPDVKILLTFFSPSGFDVRKNYPLADHIFYLPWDTPSNADWFARQVRPALAVFVKYEFWFHYSRALKQQHIPLISISAIFRHSHIYFKPLGSVFRTILKNFSYFFVQNEESLRLLQTIGITDASVAGDTRFDRVAEVAGQAADDNLARAFKGSKRLMVIGSAWPEDMAVLLPFMNAHRDLGFIVAPHEISESFIGSIEKSIAGKTIRYTKTNEGEAGGADVLIVDTIGLLAGLYRYGEFAFVGGGFRQGLHNTLEAACFGIPVFFGSTAPYDRYQEAVDLVSRGGAFAVRNGLELNTAFERVYRDTESYRRAAIVCRDYVESNKGATKKITQYLLKTLDAWKAA